MTDLDRRSFLTSALASLGLGGVGTLVDGITINALRGPDRISPFFIPAAIVNLASIAAHTGRGCDVR